MRSRYRLLLGLLVAVGAALRFTTLDTQSFWLDETVTVKLIRLSFGDMLAEIPGSESTPPLYYVVAWGWSKLFGTGEVGLRSLSALCGTAAIPVTYLAAVQFGSRRAGLLAAALVSVSPFMVWYSQEARGFALLVLLGTLSLFSFGRAVKAPSRGVLAWWAIASALALLTHYLAVFVVAPEALWLLVAGTRGRVARPAAAAVGLVALALVPLAFAQRENDGAGFIDAGRLLKRVVEAPKQFLVGFDAHLEVGATAVAGLLVVAALWILVRRADEDERSGASIVGAIAATAVLVPVLLAIVGADYLIGRNLIVAWIPAAIVVAIGFSSRAAPRLGAGLGVTLCALLLLTVVFVAAEPRFQRDDWRGAAEAIRRSAGPRGSAGPRAIVATPASGGVPLEFYLSSSRPLTREEANIREIDLVALAPRGIGGGNKPPRPPDPPAALRGSVRVKERLYAETFTLVRLSSSVPVFETLEALGERIPTEEKPAVFVYTPHLLKP